LQTCLSRVRVNAGRYNESAENGTVRVTHVGCCDARAGNTAAFNSYYAYFSKWDFDEQTATVTHHIESSLLPWETGLTLHRQAHLDSDQLILRAHYSLYGVEYVRTLVWQRL